MPATLVGVSTWGSLVRIHGMHDLLEELSLQSSSRLIGLDACMAWT